MIGVRKSPGCELYRRERLKDKATRITGGGSGYAAILVHAEGVLYGTDWFILFSN
jgi:hypothetical protein